ncbi:MAG: hypothetical protein HY079_03565 [Elusimicrobia bacterium]|nr:hypothetical protein [Elusimicrobiota bacterium]
MTTRTAALAALLAALAAPAWTAGWTVDAVVRGRDPDAAARFLADEDGRRELAARDPDAFRSAFAAATDLKSVADIIRAKDSSERYVRDGLQALPGCEFCQRPAELEAWALENLRDADRDALRVLANALYDWDTLPSALRARLSSEGRTPAAWTALDLPERTALVTPWLDETYARLMSAMPRTEAEFADYKKELDCSLMMPPEKRALLWSRVAALEMSVKRLAELRRRAAAAEGPEAAVAAIRAGSASSLEERLSILSRAFDGLGSADAALAVAAPAQAGQAFDDASRAAVATMLRSALFIKIAGTWAGDETIAFYAAHPLDLRIAPETSVSTVGSYSRRDGAIRFSEGFIVKFLKAHGRTVRDLQTDGPLLDALVTDVAALFVHEATHQRQKAWTVESVQTDLYSQDDEIEAKENGALFVLQKSLQDPAFRARLQADAREDGPAMDAAVEANDLRDMGPAAYRDSIRRTYSPIPSLEGSVHEEQARVADELRFVEGELERRKTLPAEEAAALEKGLPRPRGDGSRAAWERLVRLAPNAELRGAADHFRRLIADPAAYDARRSRQRRFDALLEERLTGLLASGPARPPRRKDPVPAP